MGAVSCDQHPGSAPGTMTCKHLEENVAAGEPCPAVKLQLQAVEPVDVFVCPSCAEELSLPQDGSILELDDIAHDQNPGKLMTVVCAGCFDEVFDVERIPAVGSDRSASQGFRRELVSAQLPRCHRRESPAEQ